MSMRKLHVFIGTRRIGELLENNDIWAFHYSPEWAVAQDGFDLSPALPRNPLEHLDGGTLRPVQWYFDNLLPEDQLRQTIAKEAGLQSEDAFSMLEYLGAESAGSLTLLPDAEAPPPAHELRALSDAELSRRIADIPNQSLTRQAPKRMSLAGAQHKLLVVVGPDRKLFEPMGATPSTHILKPEHPQSATYPASVLNEYLTMTMAASAGLSVPRVMVRYVPQPVYLIERFDRKLVHPKARSPAGTAPAVERLHIIDACQLLNKARTFKHSGATLAALREVIERTTNKVDSSLRLFRWLAFNVLAGNDDTHLKNLSFMVSADGIALAPHYDLLCTGAYWTRAIADDNAKWAAVPMAIPLPDAKLFGEVSREKLLRAGEELGVPPRVAGRILENVIEGTWKGFHVVKQAHRQLAEAGTADDTSLAIQTRLLDVIEHITLRDMTQRLSEGE